MDGYTNLLMLVDSRNCVGFSTELLVTEKLQSFFFANVHWKQAGHEDKNYAWQLNKIGTDVIDYVAWRDIKEYFGHAVFVGSS